MSDHSLSFLAFDTPAHRIAQGRCQHIFHHAIDSETKRNAEEMLTGARRSGDAGGMQTAMVLLSERCEHRLAPNADFKELITSFEDDEINRESDYAMARLLQLINDAEETGYFKPLNVSVLLYMQTIDGGPYPTLTIALLPSVELCVPGLDIDDLVNTEHTGVEQALAILTTVYTLVEQTLTNFRKHFAPASA